MIYDRAFVYAKSRNNFLQTRKERDTRNRIFYCFINFTLFSFLIEDNIIKALITLIL